MQEFLQNNESILMSIIIFFIAYLIIFSTYLLIKTILGSMKIKRQASRIELSNRLNHEYYVPLSLIIPTYNNEKEVVKTVKSLLNLDYNLYEIIVIDDASSDKTVKSLIKQFDLHLVDKPIRRILNTKEVLEVYQTSKQKIKITVAKKEHGGKADSLNAGMNIADFPYIVPLSYDARLDMDSLKNLVAPILEDDKVVLCKGIAKSIEKEENLLQLGQTLIYNRAYHTEDDKKNTSIFTLYKRDVALEVGGYDFIGENFELSRKIEVFCKEEKNIYHMKESLNAFCYINTPNNISKLWKQRKNISKAFIRGFFKYRDRNLLKCIYQFVYNTISPIVLLIGMLSIVLGIIYLHIDFLPLLIFLLVYLLLNITCTLVLYIEVLRLDNKNKSLAKAMAASLIDVTVVRVIDELAKLSAPFKIKEEQ